MSAWIVSKNHIDALVTFAVNNEIVFEHNGQTYKVSENPHRVGLELWAENHRSVNVRYNETTPVPPYSFSPLAKDVIVVSKSIACYDYQACECDDYDTTFAKAFVIAVEKKLETLGASYNRVKDLKEFDAAPWCID